ncbi:AraC family transcriptional regulator [Chitinophaga sp. XS-30]|uniref:helix-turn-helix domain-containing protein n=1 Tax=Chitinophaga sp. XS-30 TaxID=2604421 RepID=UPI0011DCCFB9|nr:helix-turn-helix transcriptional regulator [Chitinophaga sp. XS-30]QEH40616.1 helix-turn-helix transcriptional regulator [Chitinophaga sp. XS-30]
MEYLIPDGNTMEKTLMPPYDHPYFIRYAEASCLTGTFGSVAVQRVPCPQFSLTQHIFKIRQPVDVHVRSTSPMITLGYFMQGGTAGTIAGLGRTSFTENHCHLSYVPPGSHFAHLEPREYAVLQVALLPSMLKELAGKYRLIREVWSSAVRGLPQGLQQTSCHIGPRTREVLHRILHCRLERPLRELQLHAHVLELLLLYIEDVQAAGRETDTRSAYHYTDDDLRALEAAIQLQRANPGDIRHHKDLAKLVHLHPRKLLDGLNLKYGINMNSLKIQTRITGACILLLETDMPVNEIAHQVGYTDSSAFIRAFKQNVGQTPLQYRHEKPGR